MNSLQQAPLRVSVIGGGIGGLVAAIALRQVGIEAHVYERAVEIREVGAGLSLWPNAVKVLDSLGLGATLRACSIPQLSGAIRTAQGKILVSASQDQMQARFGAPAIVMHRAALVDLLRAQLPTDVLHGGAQLASFSDTNHGVTARFVDGRVLQSDALIGADGLRSIVREQLWGASLPRYAGYTAWRAVVRPGVAIHAGGETWGRGARFGFLPMAEGWVYWFATINAPEGTPALNQNRKQTVLEHFHTWHQPIAALIEATDPTAILHNDIYDRPALPQWSAGNITLLGDAAHPMTPNLGQGACQAIEDGVVLARCLQRHKQPATAFKQYEYQRQDRTNTIVARSRQIGMVGQWSNPLACTLRNMLMRITPASAQMRQLAPIIGYTV